MFKKLPMQAAQPILMEGVFLDNRSSSQSAGLTFGLVRPATLPQQSPKSI